MFEGPNTTNINEHIDDRNDDLVDLDDLDGDHVDHCNDNPTDGTAEGVGPSGTRHDRFRAWKEDLRDA